MKVCFVILGLLASANSQCTLPTLAAIFRAHDNSISLNTTSATAGNVAISVGSIGFTCVAQTAQAYVGRISVVIAQAGMCFVLDPIPGTTSHMRFAYRTNLTTIFGQPVNAVQNVATSAACNSGDRPDHERIMIDSSVSTLTAVALPATLANNFTYTVSSSCGSATDTVEGSSTVLQFNTGSCTAASSVIGTGTLHCLGSMTLNGLDFTWFSDQLTVAGAVFYCAAHSASGSSVSMTLERGNCSLSQTATTTGGTATNALSLALTVIPTTNLFLGVAGGGAGTLLPSLLLLTATAIYTRLS